MSQLVRLDGKHTYQNAHCALVVETVQEAVSKIFKDIKRYSKIFKDIQRYSKIFTAGSGKSPGGRFNGADNLLSFSVSYSPMR